MIVKDFETNGTADNGGKYQFANTAFWADVRSGTTVVLRQLAGPAGYVPDYDASDYTLDLLLGNTTYLTNVGGGTIFNITQYDMVMLKAAGSPATGVTGAIHTFATRAAIGGAGAAVTANYQSAPGYKMAAPDLDNGGVPSKFVYPLNPTQTLPTTTARAKPILGSTALNWGFGFGTPNITYIQILRNAVTGPDLVVLNGQTHGRRRQLQQHHGAERRHAHAAAQHRGGHIGAGAHGRPAHHQLPVLSGAGSFELQAGAELQICDPAGIAAAGATGAIQLAGARRFSPDACTPTTAPQPRPPARACPPRCAASP